MTRTRRADSADPAHETVDSTKQLKDTKRHLPGKSKLPRAKEERTYPRRRPRPPARQDEEVRSAARASRVRRARRDVEGSQTRHRAAQDARVHEPEALPAPRRRRDPARSPQQNRECYRRGYRDEDARSRAAGDSRVARNEGEGTGYFHRRCVEPRGVSHRGAIRPNVRKKPGVVVFHPQLSVSSLCEVSSTRPTRWF